MDGSLSDNYLLPHSMGGANRGINIYIYISRFIASNYIHNVDVDCTTSINTHAKQTRDRVSSDARADS